VLVTFEGIEGCGKSSVLRAVAQTLGQSGREAVTTREPGGTAVGERIRDIFLDGIAGMGPLAEALLANASRAELVQTVIRPGLARHAIVLCDRFTDSTVAYQGYGRGLDPEMLLEMCKIATGGLMPDLTLLLDVPVDVSRKRVGARARDAGHEADRMERENDDFHERVRAGYLQLAKRFSRFFVLDGCLPPESLSEAVSREIDLRTPVP